jgi:hypothetical protein
MSINQRYYFYTIFAVFERGKKLELASKKTEDERNISAV